MIESRSIALVPAGHGVAPVAMFLVYGWERYAVGTALAWLAIALVGASPWIRHALAPALSLSGAIAALAAWILLEARADDPLLGVLASLPFLIGLAVHAVHLWRIRAAGAPSGSA